MLDGDDLRSLLTGGEDAGADKKISRTGRLAVRIGRATGLTTDPARIRKASYAYMPIGKNVVVLGGGLVGCEIAEFLAERGRRVKILASEAIPALEMAHPRRFRVLHELEELGVEVCREAEATGIDAHSVFYTQKNPDGTVGEETTPADAVIIASGLEPAPELARMLDGIAPEIQVLGDATGVDYLEGAIGDGFHAARRL